MRAKITDRLAPLIIQAKPEHIREAKALADANRAIFAFITRQAFEEAYTQKGLLVALEEEQVIGFIRYYHRKSDRQTTLYEICVSEEWRQLGIGKQLLLTLISECSAQNRESILLKCPARLVANKFYLNNGFTLLSTQPGKRDNLNIWQLRFSGMEAQ